MTRHSSMAVLAAATFVLVGSVPAQAQTDNPLPQGYGPAAADQGHFHEGELGEKLMLVETALKCNCGCGLDAHSCQFQMQCGTSPVWTLRIRQQLEAGETVDAVKASFVAEYGTEVLMLGGGIQPPRLLPARNGHPRRRGAGGDGGPWRVHP